MKGTTESRPGCGFAFSLFIVAAALAISFLVFFLPECERKRLLESGLPGTGVIVDIRDTGNRYNDQPEVELTVDVTPREGAGYRTTTTMAISPVYLPRFQPGMRVGIRYEAGDRANIAIESNIP